MNNRGLSLIELLIYCSISTIVLLGAGSLLIQKAKLTKKIDQRLSTNSIDHILYKISFKHIKNVQIQNYVPSRTFSTNSNNNFKPMDKTNNPLLKNLSPVFSINGYNIYNDSFSFANMSSENSKTNTSKVTHITSRCVPITHFKNNRTIINPNLNKSFLHLYTLSRRPYVYRKNNAYSVGCCPYNNPYCKDSDLTKYIPRLFISIINIKKGKATVTSIQELPETQDLNETYGIGLSLFFNDSIMPSSYAVNQFSLKNRCTSGFQFNSKECFKLKPSAYTKNTSKYIDSYKKYVYIKNVPWYNEYVNPLQTQGVVTLEK